ncbi:hypothetical protein BGZ67_000972 [Mortierella alpina]|nr:hypothetical protein BGZ67_000972 [Mortierella alpina]
MMLLSFLQKTSAALVLILALSSHHVAAQSLELCLATPSDPSCVSFELPAATITADLDNLCSSMPFMPGCSLYKSCQDASKTDQWCTPFSVLADICAVDMPNMGGCKNYVALCGTAANQTTASRPAICKKAPMIPSFPTTKNASALVLDICGEMSMAGCEKCPKPPPDAYAANCDTLGTYAILCKAMPDMHQCATWKQMCSASDLGFQSSQYCAAGVGGPEMDPPQMRMFFHLGFSDYTYHATLEARWAEEQALASETKSDSSEPLTAGSARPSWIVLHWVHLWRQPWTLQEATQNVIRAVLTFVETTLGYALMLVTMTFNVPLFFAVIVGLTIGAVVFARPRAALSSRAGDGSSGTGCAGCG